MSKGMSHRAGMIAASVALAAGLSAAALAARAGDLGSHESGARRPKICLVLSGGGARGAVLKRGAGVGGGMLLWGREAH